MKNQIAEKYRKLLEHPGDIVVIDTETTGANKLRDYPVSIAIVNGLGDELMNTLVKPPIPVSEGAAKVHGISEDLIAKAPHFTDLYIAYLAATKGKTKLAYNSAFDSAMIGNATRQFLPANPPESDWECVMLDYAAFNGEPGRYGKPKWWKLTEACATEGIEVVDAHDALGDVRMTLKLMNKMAAYSSTPKPQEVEKVATAAPLTAEAGIAPLTTEAIQEQLKFIAGLESGEHLTRLRSLRSALTDQFDYIDGEIQRITTIPNDLRANLKEQAHEAALRGETVDHTLVTVKRKMKWEYDRTSALVWAQEHSPASIKTTLIVRHFEKILAQGESFYDGFPDAEVFLAEQVEQVIIALPTDLSYLVAEKAK